MIFLIIIEYYKTQNNNNIMAIASVEYPWKIEHRESCFKAVNFKFDTEFWDKKINEADIDLNLRYC